jgi:hypothetical protein
MDKVMSCQYSIELVKAQKKNLISRYYARVGLNWAVAVLSLCQERRDRRMLGGLGIWRGG